MYILDDKLCSVSFLVSRTALRTMSVIYWRTTTLTNQPQRSSSMHCKFSRDMDILLRNNNTSPHVGYRIFLRDHCSEKP